MARPREFSDEAIFYGVYLALCKKGYGRLALTDVSNEAGISPAALLKRFGSKKALFLAYSDYVIQLTDKSYKEALTLDTTPIEALRRIFKNALKLASDPISLANHTSFYLESTSDPDLLERSKKRLKLIDRETQGLILKAIDNKEIKSCNVELISTVLQSAVTGAMLIWLKDSDKTLEELIDGCFQVIFEPLLL